MRGAKKAPPLGDPMSKLTLAQANKIIETALAASRNKGYRAMAVVVLDDAGHWRSMQREDGASMFRIDIASGKAWAAVSMGASSRALPRITMGSKSISSCEGPRPAALRIPPSFGPTIEPIRPAASARSRASAPAAPQS